MCLAANILDSLEPLAVVPRRLLLETNGVPATVPMLRGVWGAALHELDGDAYRAVFSPASGQVPGYVLRPAPPDPHFAPAVDWILIGDAADHEHSLVRAWIAAAQRGLGKQRQTFQIRQVRAIRLDGTTTDEVFAWSLRDMRWPLPADAPCRLAFPSPLRLIWRGRLIVEPALTDLVVAACRRLKLLLPAEAQPRWAEMTERAIGVSREAAQLPWAGAPLDLVRYSGRQQREVQINGVSGWLDRPGGPGPLWPLLAAAQWLHLGKSTAVGLGQLVVEDAGR